MCVGEAREDLRGVRQLKLSFQLAPRDIFGPTNYLGAGFSFRTVEHDGAKARRRPRRGARRGPRSCPTRSAVHEHFAGALVSRKPEAFRQRTRAPKLPLHRRPRLVLCLAETCLAKCGSRQAGTCPRPKNVPARTSRGSSVPVETKHIDAENSRRRDLRPQRRRRGNSCLRRMPTPGLSTGSTWAGIEDRVPEPPRPTTADPGPTCRRFLPRSAWRIFSRRQERLARRLLAGWSAAPACSVSRPTLASGRDFAGPRNSMPWPQPLGLAAADSSLGSVLPADPHSET